MPGRRAESETDTELLGRLQAADQLPPGINRLAQSFLSSYRRARFGADTAAEALVEPLEALEAALRDDRG